MHIDWGGQFDPHYEHEFAPQLKKCHLKDRNKIYNISKSGIYDKIYMLFITSRQYLENQAKILISGYYEVDQDKIQLDRDYGDPVIYAKNAVFLDTNNCIEINKDMEIKQFIRLGFNSLTNGEQYYDFFKNTIDYMNKQINSLSLYKEITFELDKIFKLNEYIPSQYKICDDCMTQKGCPLINRIKKKGKLYDRIPRNTSDIINKYYKNFYENK